MIIFVIYYIIGNDITGKEKYVTQNSFYISVYYRAVQILRQNEEFNFLYENMFLSYILQF